MIDYKIANGIYKVDSTDVKSLKIICDDQEKNSDMIAIEYFVNSNGVINEFAFGENEITMTDGNGEEIVVYQKSDKEYDETIQLDEVSTKQKVLAKTYDDAMVVTIILTAGIMSVIILIKFRTKVDD